MMFSELFKIISADLNNYDIDACIVSETHLKPDIPDSVVNIPGEIETGWETICATKVGLPSTPGTILKLQMYIVQNYTNFCV